MNANKVGDSSQIQIPSNRTKDATLRKDMSTEEHGCDLTCDRDEELMSDRTVIPASDTRWKIGCYNVNPATESGN